MSVGERRGNAVSVSERGVSPAVSVKSCQCQREGLVPL